MPDFDANDDPMPLSGATGDDPFAPPKLFPRFAPRARALATTSCNRRLARAAPRLQPELVLRRRNASRRACGDRVVVPAEPSRRLRRLWKTCHGRPSGSPS